MTSQKYIVALFYKNGHHQIDFGTENENRKFKKYDDLFLHWKLRKHLNLVENVPKWKWAQLDLNKVMTTFEEG